MEQTSTLTECPCCNSKLNSGFLPNRIAPKTESLLIREYSSKKHSDYCIKCSAAKLPESKQKLHADLKKLSSEMEPLLKDVLVVSAQNPLNWNYNVLEMVTGQSTTGTGVFSEFKSSFTDLFGAQSGSYNKKISNGEELCQTQLRLKCLTAGGNAVLAADIDYAEVGGEKGMLMVCMTGTAVKLENTEVLGSERAGRLKKIQELSEKKQHLMQFVN